MWGARLYPAHDYQARVLLNGSPETAVAIGADGLHLSSRELFLHKARPVSTTQLLAASCHSPRTWPRLPGSGADFALLSPVLPTRSHPDADPLGWLRFAAWVEDAKILGVCPGGYASRPDETAWAHGAQGVAGIRGLWGDGQTG